MLEDLGSFNGTYVNRGGSWTQIQREEVSPQTRIRFGGYITTVGECLAAAPRKRRSPNGPYRNELGEIIE